MATTLSIATGPLTSQRTFNDDTKAQATLLAFYSAFRLGPESATPQEKLDAILNWIAIFIRNKAVLYHIEQSRTAATAAGDALYDLGGIEPTTE